MTSRQDCLARDAADPLATLREQFALPAGKVYLDGNSLGVLPRATPRRVAQVVEQEWGEQLIESWNTAGWIDLPRRVGNKIARLVGAGVDELVVADSKALPSHHRLLARGLRVLENLVLDGVDAGDYELIALPLKLVEADASPVRAVLREL